MGTVSNILKGKGKGNAIISISPGTTVYKALEVMVEKNVSALLVMENEKLVGIFTERDYARKVVLKGKTSSQTNIEEVMSEDVITIGPHLTIDECMRMMTDRFIRHLPIVEEDKVLGIVSIGDVVKFIIEDQKFIIQHMEHYITGI
ncbi:MAG: CBS domain-containing protein [Ferruginibacter sp.]